MKNYEIYLQNFLDTIDYREYDNELKRIAARAWFDGYTLGMDKALQSMDKLMTKQGEN